MKKRRNLFLNLSLILLILFCIFAIISMVTNLQGGLSELEILTVSFLGLALVAFLVAVSS
jgi:hypothetical protein